MRTSVLWAVLVSVLFTSCLKKNSGCGYAVDNTQAPAAEQQLVKSYLDSVGIKNAVLDSNGFYYLIISPGSGLVPSPCSQVTVAYQGQLANGAIFAQQSDVVYTLGSLIDGWREGLPLIQSGGQIKLFIPPSLGYGANGNSEIPANSILIFNISLINVQ
jgi:FKBP-type peptidyl-prolyl cis-trans isomerase FkpA